MAAPAAPAAAGGGSKKIIVILAAVVGVGGLTAAGIIWGPGLYKKIAGGSDDNATEDTGKAAAAAADWSTAEASMKTILNGLADNRPEIIWEALPAGHKATLNGEVKKAIGNVDPEVVAKVREIVQTASGIANNKQTELSEAIMLVAVAQESGQLPPAGTELPSSPEIDEVIGYAAEALKFLSDSKLLDAAWLANPDVGEFIQNDLTKLLTHPQITAAIDDSLSTDPTSAFKSLSEARSALRSVEITVVSSDENRATLQLKSAELFPQDPSSPPQEPSSPPFVFVKVEDRWVPEQIANISMLTQSPDVNQFTGLTQMSPGQKSVLMKFLTSLAGVLDAVAKQDTGRKMAEAALPGFAALTPQIATLQRAFPQLAGGSGPSFPGGSTGPGTAPPVLPGLPGAPLKPQGKTIRWTINGGKPMTRVDTIYMNKPAANVKAMFGNPDSIEQGFWVYKDVRVVNITGGGIHNTLLFRMTDGTVTLVASQNR